MFIPARFSASSARSVPRCFFGVVITWPELPREPPCVVQSAASIAVRDRPPPAGQRRQRAVGAPLGGAA
jgi:hypothetical protein